MKKKTLVILTTHFGTNFSGGSTATCEIFSRIEGEFQEIVVVGNDCGIYPFKKIKFIKYRNWIHCFSILRSLRSASTIFYGDFYNSFIFVLLNIPFYFTYHDNWPELGKTSFRNRLRSIFYTNIYKTIFKRARKIFTVSGFKSDFIGNYNNEVYLVRNGFNRSFKNQNDNIHEGIIMVGNIDLRKYKLAIPLFKLLGEERLPNLKIDIYGNISDRRLANKLRKFPFVELKGFVPDIPYRKYRFLLHTSMMENLPIVFCEAIDNRLPVVCFDVGGIREVLNIHAGRLIEGYDIKAMKEVVKEMMDNGFTPVLTKPRVDEFDWGRASREYLRLIA